MLLHQYCLGFSKKYQIRECAQADHMPTLPLCMVSFTLSIKLVCFLEHPGHIHGRGQSTGPHISLVIVLPLCPATLLNLFKHQFFVESLGGGSLYI